MFGFDQELGGVVNQSPILERGKDPLATGGNLLNTKTIIIAVVVIFIVYKFVLKK